MDHFYKEFRKQKEAFEFAESRKDVHVFAEQISTKGARKYFAATLPGFWSMYSKLPMKDRHFYEVIPEGKQCKLYFDLEYETELNPGSNGPEMVDTFIKYMRNCLWTTFEIKCDRNHVLDLDSSTSSKFSRHLIFNSPGLFFQDNINAGYFVKKILKDLTDKLEVSSPTHSRTSHEEGATAGLAEEMETFHEVPLIELRKLLVKSNKKGGVKLFVDTGVYDRNRNFRLYLSTKMGKHAPLQVAKENKFKGVHERSTSSSSEDEQVFLDSLISYISPYKGPDDAKGLTFDGPGNSSSSSKCRGKKRKADGGSDGVASPYPEIDEFISRNIFKGGVPGRIRKATYFPETHILNYDIENNRWCDNIRRSHKSNNIKMVVDLRIGEFYQKCYDPDCKDFKSEGQRIPPEIMPEETDVD